jgi:predicted RNase H-like HicB family nuclease
MRAAGMRPYRSSRVHGAATWGHTQEEALRNIQEVVQVVIEELLEDGELIPAGLTVADEPAIAVTVG